MTAATMVAPRCDCCGAEEWSPLFAENGFRLGQCQQCDLLYVDPMPSLAHRMTEMERGHFADGQQVLDAARQVRAETARRAAFAGYVTAVQTRQPRGRWLDVGCGAGELMRHAQAAGFAVEGIELTADRRAAAQRAGFTVHDRPAEELDVPPGTFDVISLIDVFSHLTSPMQTLRRLRELLATDGVLLLATGEALQPPRRRDVYAWNLGDHLHFLGATTMASYAATVGLEIVQHDRDWLPAMTWTRERLTLSGRSPVRNLAKALLVHTPGALAALRALVLRRERGNPVHASVILLRPVRESA